MPFVWTIFFLFLAFVAHAQAPAAPKMSAEEVQGAAVAERFMKKMKSLKSFRTTLALEISFQQIKTPRKYSAKLEVRDRCFYFSGMDLEIYSDGQTRWQYAPLRKEVVISTIDTAARSPLENPLSIFSAYTSDFKIFLQGERTEKNITYYDLSLYPRDTNQPYSQIHLALNKKTLHPVKASYIGRDGSRYILSFSQFEANAAVRTHFKPNLKKWKGANITDLR